MKKEETFKCRKDTPTGSYKAGVITPNPSCADFPEYFGQFILTTNDGVDIYNHEKCVAVKYGLIYGPDYFKGGVSGYTYFSTPEAAQAYLDEQNKPKFEVGKVYKSEMAGIFFLTKINDRAVLYGYGFRKDGSWFFETEDNGWTCACNDVAAKDLVEATPAEWEAALIKEADRKYPVGSKITPLWGDLKEWDFNPCYAGTTGFSENKYGNPFYYKGQAVMLNGKWASIISEPEKQKTTAEYIEEFKSKPLAFHHFEEWLSENNLIITKAPSNA